MGIKDVTKLASVVGDQIDKNSESGEERQAQLSARHVVDMNSDNKRSKEVRPNMLYLLMLLEFIIVIAEIAGAEVSEAIMIQVGGLLATAVGFYFESKKKERVAAKNAAAQIKIQEITVKEDIKVARKEARQERRREKRNAE